MRKFKRFLILSLWLSFHIPGRSQSYDSALQVLGTKFPSEKLYIHYDKEYYVAGETIWFKAYLYSKNSPSGLSDNLYVQLINASGKIVQQLKFPVLGAVAKGNISLQDSLPGGNYFVRAFTPGMLNYGEDLIYKKNIFIFNPSSAGIAEKPETPSNVSLQFFPESGNLVDGLLTVVGFKAVDQWGAPVEVEGIIKTAEGSTVAPFKSYHDGIGKTQFIPVIGKKYSAEIQTNGGVRTYPLPEVQASGVNLKVQDEKGGKVFQLALGKTGRDAFESVDVVVEMNNTIVYENSITFDNYPSVRGHLLTDSLPSGILHFTVFNQDKVPVAERLAFVDNREYRSEASLNVSKPGFDKRMENVVELAFPDSAQRSCSIAITDAGGLVIDNKENIYSRLLLSDDLKGYVYNTAWYFSQNDSAKTAIDNLLMTQGWIRFKWTKILNKGFPGSEFHDEPGITLFGVVNNAVDKAILGGGKVNVYLQSEDSSTQNYTADVDGSGRFVMKSVTFRGKSKLYYAYMDASGKEKPSIIHIDENTSEKQMQSFPGAIQDNTISTHFASAVKDTRIDQRYADAKKEFNQVKELEKVVLTSKTNKKPIDIVNEKYTSGVFRTMGKENIDNINDPANDRSMNAVDFIKNRVRQVEIEDGSFVNRKNFSLISGKKWIVAVFVNEEPSDLNYLRTIRTDQIAMVKFYEAGFVGVGSGAPGGAIAVYTKEMVPEEVKTDKLQYIIYNGYAISREFYQPDYTTEGKHEVVDNRTTLYWNADVYTDASSKTFPIHFFNNDFSKKFRIIVEGFDAAGKLIHIEKIIGN